LQYYRFAGAKAKEALANPGNSPTPSIQAAREGKLILFNNSANRDHFEALRTQLSRILQTARVSSRAARTRLSRFTFSPGYRGQEARLLEQAMATFAGRSA